MTLDPRRVSGFGHLVLPLRLLVLVAALTSCAGTNRVVRKRGDVEETGRAISPLAYAWYARGLHHERSGELLLAGRDFGEATRLDPRSGSAWAAWGRVLCTEDADLSRRLFAEGLERAERRAPIFIERGRCQLATLRVRPSHGSGDETEGLEAARRDAWAAVRLEPHNVDANALLVECTRGLGRKAEAERIERGYRWFTGTAAPETSGSRYEPIDAALWSRDLEGARAAALTVMTPGELGARAALWGRTDLAEEQARHVLAANPQDMDAQVTLLCLGRDAEEAPKIDDFTALSPTALMLLHSHIARAVGHNVADAFLEKSLAGVAVQEDRRLSAILLSSLARSTEIKD